MYSDRRGYGQKPPRTKPSRQKTLGQKPWRTIEREFVQWAFVRIFVLGLLKIGGSEMCDILLGVPGCVTKCDRGVKIGQKYRDVLYGQPPEGNISSCLQRVM